MIRCWKLLNEAGMLYEVEYRYGGDFVVGRGTVYAGRRVSLVYFSLAAYTPWV